MNFFKKIFSSNTKADATADTIPLSDGGIAAVRQLEIKSRKLTNHLFTGEYHSAFKGTGMVFKEVKEYTAGDDVRFIDWNVSARMGSAYSKVFEEERELSVYLLIDASASNLFGTQQQSKKELITEIAAVLAFSAANNNDKAALLFCTNTVEKYIPPKKGRQHVLYMIRELINFKPKGVKTDLVKALQYMNNASRHKSIVFILSDFADDGYEKALRVTAKKHDVIGIQVYDKADYVFPKMGLLQITDAETGTASWIDTNDKQTRASWDMQHRVIIEGARESFKKAGADLLQVATGEDYVKLLQQFFIKRA
ncbi:DUF58 domain-containing protein [Parasediminibacterium sp. JCM 36343]|uniref:DUF58 domain-containing protein n=1 Tax=Parasediminibacterium sp. JCM 36343 TaxID=3374279 RepID=UPI00397C239A